MYAIVDIGGNSTGLVRRSDKKLIFIYRFKRWLTFSEQLARAPKIMVNALDLEDAAERLLKLNEKT